MKKVFMMLSLVGATMFANAQDAPAAATPDPNAAEIKWENMTLDYGTITKGDEKAASREFKFINTGKSPLIISSCRGSCGCTVPTCPTEPVLPGAKGTIKVHYDINRVGPFTKTVTVTSNAKNANETLKIQGTVNDVESAHTPTETTPSSTVVPSVKATPATPAPVKVSDKHPH
ncbi:MAG: DUF1573 domain-containing protein [Bacteroidetes bacterium]|nr:DUF1573 domain-containing protein [Bacteroidota bacterium]